eukprot:7095527-Prymnesium_polylepis.1
MCAACAVSLFSLPVASRCAPRAPSPQRRDRVCERAAPPPRRLCAGVPRGVSRFLLHVIERGLHAWRT